MPFSGHNITDTNLIQGESIIRSYLYGYNYLKDKFNYIPEGFDRNDTFGNSAQVSQIVRGFGGKWVTNVVFTKLSAPYWRGVDGSVVCQVDPQRAATCGGYAKYRPCPACRGYGDESCSVCEGTRIDREFIEARHSRINVRYDEPQSEALQGILYISGEEILPDEKTFDWIEANKDKYNIFFSDFVDVAHRYYGERIAAADEPSEQEVAASPEVNYNNTGCYVTRINTKKYVRAAENRIYAAESMAVMNSLRGGKVPDFNKIWDKLLFTMFHDAVTGTMVDAAYEELCDLHREIDASISSVENELTAFCTKDKSDMVTVINPNPVSISGTVVMECPVGKVPTDANGERLSAVDFEVHGETVRLTAAVNNIPPFGRLICTLEDASDIYKRHVAELDNQMPAELAPVLRIEENNGDSASGESRIYVIENEYFRVKADKNGISEIFDKRLSRVIACEGEYRVGEWILEHDEGSPWMTLSDDRRRIKLSQCTELVTYEKTADAEKLTFAVNKRFWGYAVDGGHDICWSVSLVRGVERVLFSSDVYWNTQNYRLRIAFPTPVSGRHFYEIPYAFLERKPYKPTCVWSNGTSNWSGADGDHPAINWAGIEGDGVSVALLNRGTPSYQINTDGEGCETIFLSVLRSPSVGTYLHEPLSYTMTDYDGMRDCGEHHFEYALASYGSGFSDNNAVCDGIGYNAELYAAKGEVSLPELPVLCSDDVRVSAVKHACNGNGFIYRLAEYHGKNATAVITVPQYVSAVYETDLREDNITELQINDGKLRLEMKPFKIKSLRFEL